VDFQDELDDSCQKLLKYIQIRQRHVDNMVDSFFPDTV